MLINFLLEFNLGLRGLLLLDSSLLSAGGCLLLDDALGLAGGGGRGLRCLWCLDSLGSLVGLGWRSTGASTEGQVILLLQSAETVTDGTRVLKTQDFGDGGLVDLNQLVTVTCQELTLRDIHEEVRGLR